MDLPKLVIRVRDGLAIFTDVTLDGKQVYATRVSLDTGEDINGRVAVSMTFLADIDIELEGVQAAVVAIRAAEHPELVEVDFGTLTAETSTARPVVHV